MLPTESLLVVLGFLSRDELDSVQISCRRLRYLVQGEEEKSLALRPVNAVHLGKGYMYVDSY